MFFVWCISSSFFLFGAFNPFTFKEIVDMYDPITIFIIVLSLLYVGLVLLLCFLPGDVL